MLNQRTANLVFVVLIISACGYFAYLAQGFTTSGLLASSGLPSKFFPQLMLGITAFCAAIVGYRYLVHGNAGGEEDESVFADGKEARQGLSMLVVAGACYSIWLFFGFLAMAVLLGPLSLLAMGVRAPSTHFIVLFLTAFITMIFVFGLDVDLV
ncbi:hypothetical protein [Thioalkalivibrio sp. HK1]|uniref:hypothetical protein n=1 Tax=Thioalkalivibrio sp. HK1 TaxID=1469245 RepID=UPI0004718221|nr:hypothetical protein [Thioalkalivibrio sp. HK1]